VVTDQVPPEVDRERFQLDRRQDDPIRTGLFGERGIEFVPGRGNDEYRNVGPLGGRCAVRATAQSPQELDCADSAERRVQHHNVERAKSEHFEGLDRVGDGAGPEPGVDQPFAQERGQLRVVADDQNVWALERW
jgi:hypothetical protein